MELYSKNVWSNSVFQQLSLLFMTMLNCLVIFSFNLKIYTYFWLNIGKPKLQLRGHSCIFSIFSCLLTIFLAILEYYLKVHWFKIFNFWYCMKSREKGKAKAVTLPLFITPPLVCHCVAANNSIESLSNSNLFATTEEAHVIYF